MINFFCYVQAPAAPAAPAAPGVQGCQSHYDYTSSTQQSNIYPWGQLPLGTTQITFTVAAHDNAHIGLASEADDSTVLAEVGRSYLFIF